MSQNDHPSVTGRIFRRSSQSSLGSISKLKSRRNRKKRQSSLSSQLSNVTNYESDNVERNNGSESDGEYEDANEPLSFTTHHPQLAAATANKASSNKPSRMSLVSNPVSADRVNRRKSAGPFHFAHSPTPSISGPEEMVGEELSGSPTYYNDSPSPPLSINAMTTTSAASIPPSHRLSSTPLFPSPLARAVYDDESMDMLDIDDPSPSQTNEADDELEDNEGRPTSPARRGSTQLDQVSPKSSASPSRRSRSGSESPVRTRDHGRRTKEGSIRELYLPFKCVSDLMVYI